MTGRQPSGPRCVALVGPYLAGKTTLLESLLFATGAIPRKGAAKDGSTVGDSSPAARARGMSVEVNVASCSFMDDEWTFLDCPGSIEFAHQMRLALMVADAAVVVCPPEAERAAMLGPLLKFLDDRQIPHVLFINKIDTAAARVSDLMSAFQAVSARKLALRQVPIRKGDAITGYVDLVSERAYDYKPGRASDLVSIPGDVMPREQEARRALLETLADFDDKLLEQLLEDTVPQKAEIYRDLAQTFAGDKIVPVLLGSAGQDAGVRRLLKLLRHETPSAGETMDRLGIEPDGEPMAQIFKTVHAPHTGKMSYARVWRGPLADGATLSDGKASARLAGIGRPLGAHAAKLAKAESGETVALGRLESFATGATLTPSGKVPEGLAEWPAAPKPLFALAIVAEKRGDDVKLSGALHRLVEVRRRSPLRPGRSPACVSARAARTGTSRAWRETPGWRWRPGCRARRSSCRSGVPSAPSCRTCSPRSHRRRRSAGPAVPRDISAHPAGAPRRTTDSIRLRPTRRSQR